MNRILNIAQDAQGIPVAEVPSVALYELVEYLSIQRVYVTYHFQHTHFTVAFPHSELAAARKLLEDWSTSREPLGQPA